MTEEKPFRYEDIVDVSWPQKDTDHPSMNLVNRAKIFLPFAALKGYEQAIQETRRLHEQEVEENSSLTAVYKGL